MENLIFEKSKILKKIKFLANYHSQGHSVLKPHAVITVDRPVVILLLINPRVHPKIAIFKLFLTIRL